MIHILTLLNNLMIKILNLKLVIILEYQNTKNIFAERYTPSWSEEVFLIKEVKNTVPLTNVINDLNGEEIIGTFHEKELQEKETNYMSHGKDMIIHVIAGLIKMNHLVEIIMLKLILVIMQQIQILKMFHMLILQVLN